MTNTWVNIWKILAAYTTNRRYKNTFPSSIYFCLLKKLSLFFFFSGLSYLCSFPSTTQNLENVGKDCQEERRKDKTTSKDSMATIQQRVLSPFTDNKHKKTNNPCHFWRAVPRLMRKQLGAFWYSAPLMRTPVFQGSLFVQQQWQEAFPHFSMLWPCQGFLSLCNTLYGLQKNAVTGEGGLEFRGNFAHHC